MSGAGGGRRVAGIVHCEGLGRRERAGDGAVRDGGCGWRWFSRRRGWGRRRGNHQGAEERREHTRMRATGGLA